MQVSIESTSPLERRMTVGVPAARVTAEMEKRLKDVAKTVRINGFRKGKVPLKVVKQRFGEDLRREVLGDIIQKTLFEAIEKQNVKIAGQPTVEPKNVADGQDFEYIAKFEVYPDVEVADLSAVSVEKPKAEVTEADVDKMIDTLRKQQAKWNSVEGAAVEGHRVNIDFEGFRDGEAFDGGAGKNQPLVLGSGTMIPGFEDGLIGASAGETRALELTFPEDYAEESLRGANVVFNVTVNAVEAEELPELGPDFYQQFGIATDSAEEFRVEVRKNMERELRNAAKEKLKTAVMDKLIELHSAIEVPKSLIANEIQTLRQQMLSQFGDMKLKADQIRQMLPDDVFIDQAKKRVSLGLIVGEIIKKNKMEPNPDKVRSTVEDIANTYEDPQEVIDYYYSNEEQLSGLNSLVLEDQVVEFVIESGSLTEVESNYEDVIRPERPNV